MEKPNNWPETVEWVGNLDEISEEFIQRYCDKDIFESYDWDLKCCIYRIFFKEEHGGPLKLHGPVVCGGGTNDVDVDDDVEVFAPSEQKVEKIKTNPKCPRSRYEWFLNGEEPCTTDPQHSTKPGTGKGNEKETGVVKRGYRCKTCDFEWSQPPPYTKITPKDTINYICTNGGDAELPKQIAQKPVQQHEITPNQRWIPRLPNYPCMKCRRIDPNSTVMAVECKKHKSQGERKTYKCRECMVNFSKEWFKGAHMGVPAHDCRGKGGMSNFRNDDDFKKYCNAEDAKHKQKVHLLQLDEQTCSPCTILQTPKRTGADAPKPFLYTPSEVNIKSVRQVLAKMITYIDDTWIITPIIYDRKRNQEGIRIPKFIELKVFTKFGKTERSPKGLIDIFGPIVEHKKKRIIFARITYSINKIQKEFKIILQLKNDSDCNMMDIDTQTKNQEAVDWNIFADLEKNEAKELRCVLRELGL